MSDRSDPRQGILLIWTEVRTHGKSYIPGGTLKYPLIQCSSFHPRVHQPGGIGEDEPIIESQSVWCKGSHQKMHRLVIIESTPCIRSSQSIHYRWAKMTPAGNGSQVDRTVRRTKQNAGAELFLMLSYSRKIVERSVDIFVEPQQKPSHEISPGRIAVDIRPSEQSTVILRHAFAGVEHYPLSPHPGPRPIRSPSTVSTLPHPHPA